MKTLSFVSLTQIPTAVWSDPISVDLGLNTPSPAYATAIKMFRNYVNFFGPMAYGETAAHILRFDVLTRTLEDLFPLDSFPLTTPVSFTETSAFVLTTSGANWIITHYDLIQQTKKEIAIIHGDEASDPIFYGATLHSMAVKDSVLFFSASPDVDGRRRIIVYDLMTNSKKNVFIDLGATPQEDELGLLATATQLHVISENSSTHNEILSIFEIDDVVGAQETDTLIPDPSLTHEAGGISTPFNAIWEDIISGGCVVYPSTLVINIDSGGEATANRSLYARKMEVVRKYLSRYVQSGVLPIINDDY